MHDEEMQDEMEMPTFIYEKIMFFYLNGALIARVPTAKAGMVDIKVNTFEYEDAEEGFITYMMENRDKVLSAEVILSIKQEMFNSYKAYAEEIYLEMAETALEGSKDFMEAWKLELIQDNDMQDLDSFLDGYLGRKK